MRGLSTRRIATTALCAALLTAITGPAAVAADSAQGRSHAASQVPASGADAPLARVESLGELGGALPPATNLVTTALKADNGRLSAAQATRLVNSAKRAVAGMTPKATANPQAKDAVSDAYAALQKALDALQKAVTSGDAGQVATAVNGMTTALVNYLAATLLASGLPTSTLPMPTLPTT
jgi:hypothetical protein